MTDFGPEFQELLRELLILLLLLLANCFIQE